MKTKTNLLALSFFAIFYMSSALSSTIAYMEAYGNCENGVFNMSCEISNGLITCTYKSPVFFCGGSSSVYRSDSLSENAVHVWYEDEGDHDRWTGYGDLYFKVCAMGLSAAIYCWDGHLLEGYFNSLSQSSTSGIDVNQLDIDGDGLTNALDGDDDGDGVSDVVDAQPYDNANSNELDFPLNSTYKGIKTNKNKN